jgi:predicted ABC-type ATPase
VKPVLLVIAGPNGAGKTTITSRLREDHWSDGVEYLNPDEVARDRYGDWNSPDAVLSAARWVDARREDLLAAGQGIAFETVLSIEAKLDFLRRAKTGGYFVRVFFVGTSDPRINAARVADRVMAGGHTVPVEKIITRYVRSMANLFAAMEIADRMYVYDNSIDLVEARLCARTEGGQLRKIHGPLPEWADQAVRDLPRHREFIDERGA